jgi:hypothetical protein
MAAAAAEIGAMLTVPDLNDRRALLPSAGLYE